MQTFFKDFCTNQPKAILRSLWQL